MRASVAALFLVVVVVVALACGVGRPPCYRGDFIGCACGEGESGYQACRDSEDGYSACVCDGTTPGVDAAPPDAGADVAADNRGLFDTCETNEHCDSGLCHLFSSLGRVCTKPCEQAEDCPERSSGCNDRGICRP